jgi:peptidyl-prolyl cis-trans isomerase SurA
VARVNDDIITRQDYVQALRDFRDELTKQMSGKSDAEIQAQYDKLKPTVLDMIIEDMLLEQKAKELGIDVEAEVNEEMIQIAKENNVPNVLDFEKALKAQGIDPEQARSAIRKRLQHQYVLQKEVLQPIYNRLTESEKQAFYAAHKDQFTIPGEVVLSEIYIPLEGSTATDIEQRARRLVAELRAGGDWSKAVQQNSPPNRSSRAQNGKLGSFKLDDLKPDIKAAIENLKAGEVTEPIRLQEGYQILKLDERKAAVLRGLDEQEVQRALGSMMTMQKAEEERKKFVAELKAQAYIYIKTGYVAADTHSSDSEASAAAKAKDTKENTKGNKEKNK